MKDFKSREGGNVLVFNDSLTHPCGTIDLSISFGDGKNKKIVRVCFLVISYESVYNDILGNSFMGVFDNVAFAFHLKMKCHQSSGKLVVITIDLRGYCLIHEKILNNPLAITIAFENGKRNVR